MGNPRRPSIYEKITAVEKEALIKARDKMRVVRLSLRTQRSYLARIAHYMVFIRERGLTSLSRKERIEAWLSDFARRRRSASTQNVGFNAIKCFFENVYEIDMGEIDAMRAKVSHRVRIPPEREDTLRMLKEVRNSPHCHYRTMAYLIYGVGLRISEALRLRHKDILFRHLKLIVRQGKGDKDRVLDLPVDLVPLLEDQLKLAGLVWLADSTNKIPVSLPDSLAIKYPANPLKQGWSWVFPSERTCIFEGREMRHHISAQAVRTELKAACRREGIEEISPHYLRHGFASDFAGDIQLLQQVMGHKNIETTMRYRHLRSTSHGSPLDGVDLMA